MSSLHSSKVVMYRVKAKQPDAVHDPRVSAPQLGPMAVSIWFDAMRRISSEEQDIGGREETLLSVL